MRTKDTILLEQAYLKVRARSLTENDASGEQPYQYRNPDSYGDDAPEYPDIQQGLEGDIMVPGGGGGFVRRYVDILNAYNNGQLTYKDGIFRDKQGNRYKIIQDERGNDEFVPALQHPSKGDADRAAGAEHIKAKSELYNRVTPPSYSATGE